jgi:drug/metabolite transporter (DMT)-like permease
MVAILGGLGAALSWAIATVASTRSSRMIGAISVIAWVMTVGFAVAAVPAVLSSPAGIEPGQILGLLVVGIANNVGLLLTYAALTIGRISIVTPIVATEGAGAAVISVILGEDLNVATVIVLAAIAVGVVLAAIERSADAEQRTDARHARRAIVLAMSAAACFSVGLVIAGRLGTSLPIAWVVMAPRLVGVVGVAIPLAVRGRLRLVRAAVPLVIVSGALEAFGAGLYVLAAQDGVATAAVLGSQFAAFSAIAAFLFFGERLARVQIAGVGLIFVGVTALAVVRA